MALGLANARIASQTHAATAKSNASAVSVRWPDGSVEEHGTVEANQILVIRQGSG